MFSAVCGASLYAPGSFCVSGGSVPVFGGSCVCVVGGWVCVGGDGVCVCVVLIESCRICVQCVFWRLSLCPWCVFGEWSSSGVRDAAFCAQTENYAAPSGFHRFFLSKSSWLVIWVGWCMAGGEQCASTSELWSVWEVMSQCGVIWLFW